MSAHNNPTDPHKDLSGGMLVAGMIYATVMLTVLCWLL